MDKVHKLNVPAYMVLAVGLLSVFAGLQAACGGKLPPNISPEGAVAIRARQVVVAGQGAVRGVEVVTDARLASIRAAQDAKTVTPAEAFKQSDAVKADARAALSVLATIGKHSQDLADVLDVVDKATDAAAQTEGLARARVIIEQIQQAVLLIPVNIGDSQVRQGLATFLGQISTAVLEVALLLPRPAPAG